MSLYPDETWGPFNLVENPDGTISGDDAGDPVAVHFDQFLHVCCGADPFWYRRVDIYTGPGCVEENHVGRNQYCDQQATAPATGCVDAGGNSFKTTVQGPFCWAKPCSEAAANDPL